MSQESSTNLKQISALFEACIAQVRNKPSVDLDKIAADWLKALRVQLMKELQARKVAFFEASRNSNDPLQAPLWAVQPDKPLTIQLQKLPQHLEPYTESYKASLKSLLKECGFQDVDNSEKPAASQITKSFDALLKFSAAILKITEEQQVHIRKVTESKTSNPA
ncbi:hypothetical protein H0H92_005685 [Tricholoma furcatifolium]|nr:hypothetical protein H0H92_005685 [Tricholoma furcatifolium]